MVVSIAAAAVTLLAVLGVAVWNFMLDPVPRQPLSVGGSPPAVTHTTAPIPTHDPLPLSPAPELPPTPEPLPTSEPPPTTQAPTTQAPLPQPPGFPASARPCAAVTGSVGGFSASAAGNNVTSCPFAEEVRKSYGHNPVRNMSVTIPAYSPVTGQQYQMTCSGERLVTCTGGNDAVVYLR